MSDDLLAGIKCRVLGIVLNAVDFASPYYSYTYRYYPYAYSEDLSERSGS